MIGTDENRAVLHVEVKSSGAANEKYHPAWSAKVLSPFCGHRNYRIFVYAFWTEPSVHLIHQLWEMPNPYIQIPLTMPRWKTMRNF